MERRWPRGHGEHTCGITALRGGGQSRGSKGPEDTPRGISGAGEAHHVSIGSLSLEQ